MWYKLDENHNPVPCEIGDLPYDGSNTVRQDEHPAGLLSTVFLYLDHSSVMGGPPVLFETMWFPTGDNASSEIQERYHTWDEALAGHMRIAAELGIADTMVMVDQEEMRRDRAKARLDRADELKRRKVRLDDNDG
ncbi:hypothetical protein EVC24_011 [Rhizobium phage RHph_I4]|nr:hypothetical protein EVC24_011 [Rhizobium phage RHph_I4]